MANNGKKDSLSGSLSDFIGEPMVNVIPSEEEILSDLRKSLLTEEELLEMLRDLDLTIEPMVLDFDLFH